MKHALTHFLLMKFASFAFFMQDLRSRYNSNKHIKNWGAFMIKL